MIMYITVENDDTSRAKCCLLVSSNTIADIQNMRNVKMTSIFGNIRNKSRGSTDVLMR